MPQTMTFMPQSDVGSLLQVSRGVRRAVAPAIRELTLHHLFGEVDKQALLRLLRQTTNLQRLLAPYHWCDRYGIAHLVAVIGDASVGGKLQALQMPHLDSFSRPFYSFLDLLKVGRLPCLVELRLKHLLPGDGPALAEALEARRVLGLPPITWLKGIMRVPLAVLLRVWACCLPDKVARLEAERLAGLAALGKYLLQHSNFTALRSLAATVHHDEDEEASTVYSDEEGAEEEGQGGAAHCADILRALAQGHAPMLEKLKMTGWTPKTAPLRFLGLALAQGKLQVNIHMHGCELGSADLQALSDGLQATPRGQVRRLAFKKMEVSEADLEYLGRAIEAEGSGLAGLEELVLKNNDNDWTPVFKALASLNPSALKKLYTSRSQTKAGLRALFQGLGRGAFPSLVELVLIDNEPDLVRNLAAALLSLAAQGLPSLLKAICITNDDHDMDCLGELTPVFAAGGLPALTDLEVLGGGDRARGLESGSSLDAWRALGPQIKLESLRLELKRGFTQEAQLLQVLADPAFCPRLRTWSMQGINPYKSKAAFKMRAQQKRIEARSAVAAAAAADA